MEILAKEDKPKKKKYVQKRIGDVSKAKIKNKSRKITGSQEKMWKAPKLTKTINLKRAFAT